MPFKEWGFPRGSAVKNPLASARDAGDMSLIPGLGRFLEEEMSITPVFLPGEFHGQRSMVG